MRHRDGNVAFLDLIFNSLLTFSGMFALAFLLISDTKDSKKIDWPAKFLIEMEWDKDSENDVDCYLEDPTYAVTYFSASDTGLNNLERDDLGKTNDFVETPDGRRIEYNVNREVVTIRNTIAGLYVCNAHMFARKDSSETPENVTMTLIQVNPYQVLVSKTLPLTVRGDEKTFFAFKLDGDGEIEEIMEDYEKRLTATVRRP